MQLAQQNHVTQLVLTDINNTSAGLNFVRKAPEFGIKPILGIDFRNGTEPCFIGIAQNNEGYLELNDFLSHHLYDGSKIPDRAPTFNNVFVVYPFEQVLLGREEASRRDSAALRQLLARRLVDHAGVGLRPRVRIAHGGGGYRPHAPSLPPAPGLSPVGVHHAHHPLHRRRLSCLQWACTTSLAPGHT